MCSRQRRVQRLMILRHRHRDNDGGRSLATLRGVKIVKLYFGIAVASTRETFIVSLVLF